MKIEVGRFPDKRLKVLKKYCKSDRNVRIYDSEISVCPKMDEVQLEEDVLEAIDLWNLMHMFPEFRSEIHEVLKRYFGKGFSPF